MLINTGQKFDRLQKSVRLLALAGLFASYLAGLLPATALASSVTQGTANISGAVFNDLNRDGARNVGEAGVAGVAITAYDRDGNQVGTATTIAGGSYTLVPAGSGPWRLEFTNLPAGYQPSRVNMGTQNGTSTQFVSSLGTQASLGVIVPVANDAPAGALLNTYPMAITYNSFTNIPAAQQYTMRLVDPRGATYSGITTYPVYLHPDWISSKIGMIGNLAVDRTGNMYGTATFHNSAGFTGSGGIPAWRYGSIGNTPCPNNNFAPSADGADDLCAAGTIYKFDAMTGQPTVFAQLPQQLTKQTIFNGYNGAVANTRTSGPGLNGISYDEKNNQFYVANVEDGKIYIVEANGVWDGTKAWDQGAADSGMAGPASFNGEVVYAVEYHEGRVYYSVRNDSTSYSTIRSIAINSAGEFDPSSDRLELTSATYQVRDIEFSRDGRMALGAFVRFTLHPFTTGSHHHAKNTVWSSDANGVWTRIALYDTQTTATYLGESYGGIAWGSYQGVPDTLLWSSSGDMVGTCSCAADKHGVIGYSVAGLPNNGAGGGANYVGFEFNSAYADAKGSGFGDVEILAPQDPIEIGNRVWNDANSNGIQDAGETGISGVQVQLSRPDGTVLGTTTTDINGNYYFRSESSTGAYSSTLRPNTPYVITVNPSQSFLSGLVPAAANAGAISGSPTSNDAILDTRDSDATVVNGVATINYTTGGSGASNHGLDFGFAPPAPTATPTNTPVPATATPTPNPLGAIGNQVWNDLNGNGIQDSGEPYVQGVKVELLSGCSGTTILGTRTTDTSGYYNFPGLTAGQYRVRFTLPSGFQFTAKNQGTRTTHDSNANTDGVTDCITLAAGQLDGTIDAGLVVSSAPTATPTNTPVPATATPTPAPVSAADLSITKSASVSSVISGVPFNYILTVVNRGPGNATNVVVTDQLPAGVAINSVVPTAGGSCSNTAGLIRCTWASLANGANATVTINVTP